MWRVIIFSLLFFSSVSSQSNQNRRRRKEYNYKRDKNHRWNDYDTEYSQYPSTNLENNPHILENIRESSLQQINTNRKPGRHIMLPEQPGNVVPGVQVLAQQKMDAETCICVPEYLCDNDYNIKQAGEGIINERIGVQPPTTRCENILQVCCLLKNIVGQRPVNITEPALPQIATSPGTTTPSTATTIRPNTTNIAPTSIVATQSTTLLPVATTQMTTVAQGATTQITTVAPVVTTQITTPTGAATTLTTTPTRPSTPAATTPVGTTIVGTTAVINTTPTTRGSSAVPPTVPPGSIPTVPTGPIPTVPPGPIPTVLPGPVPTAPPLPPVTTPTGNSVPSLTPVVTTRPTIMTTPTVPQPQCGVSYASSANRELQTPENMYITAFTEFPWMLALTDSQALAPDGRSFNNAFICGASLLSKDVAMTAAHCIKGRAASSMFIRAGAWNTLYANESIPYQDRSLSKVILHPEFNNSTLYNDVAILKLDQPVIYANNVQPICMPKPEDRFTGQNCIATGWGQNIFGSNGRYATKMRKVELKILNRTECQNKLRKTRLGSFFNLHDSFTCAEGNTDTCTGDGGGPLFCKVGNTYTQTGIVSWGIGCGQKDVPGVYVDVPAMKSWIDATIYSLMRDNLPK